MAESAFPSLPGIDPPHVETIKHTLEQFKNPNEKVAWCDWIESNVTSSKFHKKLLVICQYRLFFFKKALVGKGITSDRELKILDLTHLLSEDQDKIITLRFGPPVSLDVRIQCHPDLSREIIKTLRIGHRYLTPGAEQGARGFLVVNVPQTSLLEIPPDTDVGPCKGYLRSYLAYCNYFGEKSRPELMRWIEDQQESNNHEMRLNSCPGVMKNSSMTPPLRPVILALSNNTWFTDVVIENIHGNKDVVAWVGAAFEKNLFLKKVTTKNLDEQAILSLEGGPDVTVLGDALSSNRFNTLQFLDLSHNNLSGNFVSFATGLKASKHLKVLHLNSCNIKAAFMVNIFEAFQGNLNMSTALEVLGLSGNKFEQIGSAAFVNWVNAAEGRLAIRRLGVAAVDFREQGLPTSVAAIAQLKLLRDLDFSNNNIQEQHVGAVAQMLTALPELNEVAFSRCALSGKSTPALIDGLQSKAHPLKIDISGNYIAVLETPAIAKSLSGILKIHTLNLSDTGMGAKGVMVIVQELPPVDTLILNKIASDESLDRFLAVYLKDHPTLRTLSLQDTKISDLTSFFMILKSNTTLLELLIDGNNLSDSQIFGLSEVLRVNQTLQFLSCDRCRLSLAAFQALSYAIQKNNGLVKFPIPYADALPHQSDREDQVRDLITSILFGITIKMGQNRSSTTKVIRKFLDDLVLEKQLFTTEWKAPDSLDNLYGDTILAKIQGASKTVGPSPPVPSAQRPATGPGRLMPSAFPTVPSDLPPPLAPPSDFPPPFAPPSDLPPPLLPPTDLPPPPSLPPFGAPTDLPPPFAPPSDLPPPLDLPPPPFSDDNMPPPPSGPAPNLPTNASPANQQAPPQPARRRLPPVTR